jgi:hypothetical protein
MPAMADFSIDLLCKKTDNVYQNSTNNGKEAEL